MDNIIVVVKIIAGRVHAGGRLLPVGAISRRELMRRVTLYCRLPRIFVPNPPPRRPAPPLHRPAPPLHRHCTAPARPGASLHFASYALEVWPALLRFPRFREITAVLPRYGTTLFSNLRATTEPIYRYSIATSAISHVRYSCNFTATGLIQLSVNDNGAISRRRDLYN